MLRGILIDLLTEVRNLKSPTVTNSEQSLFVRYPDISFPITNEIEMAKFEDELKKEENFINAVSVVSVQKTNKNKQNY